ncbi:peptidase associated domain and porin domain-containing protein [Sphingobacterium bovistauri]|uniref:Uncharacterized protein n=1 Tax=Sphingobacterium bovistauri TaxID=2781959 RepID=A0ABS7Z2C0_9SPHI|nr:hypothetical protein [Sphingobacterium bovistauri]MCA5004295.1 hypothetical protein [Sphingobacterium bovistauri]
MNLRILYLLVVSLFITFQSHAQSKIKGFIIDSTHNNMLRSVSVSVFEKGKETVDKVGLTDRFGKFEISDLTFNKQYVAEFTYLGYQKAVREFVMKQNQELDLGHINMPFIENEIEAVDVIPPVRMNGDTLEFNADAFQLDSNAVVEDLLRRLPGLVVWGDGAITYNGREIPSVLVNGKPFFGGDMATAIQNIDKKAVKTVQVYDSRDREKQREDPDDKKYQMNLILKEGKDNILMGSVGAGGGTEKRYDGNLNLNRSTKRAQTTLAYSVNNVNKSLNSIDQLLKNTTFKGIGINADFDSDFMRTGILQQNVLGGRYQYDFLGTNEVGKDNLLKASVLNRWDNSLQMNESTSRLLDVVQGQENFRTNRSTNDNTARRHDANISYNNSVSSLGKRPITVRSILDLSQNNNESLSTTFNEYALVNNQSKNETENSSQLRGNSASFNTTIDLHGKAGRHTFYRGGDKYSFTDQLVMTLNVRAGISDNNNAKYTIGDYKNYLNADLNRLYHRDYNEDFDSRNLQLDLKIMDQTSGVTLGTKARWNATDMINVVTDFNNAITASNQDLSHVSNFNNVEYEPYVEFGRTLKSKNLYGRMNSHFYFSSTIAGRFYKDKNESTLDYRNLGLAYQSFLPSLRLNYSYSRQNSFHSSLSLNYNYNEEYPLLDRMRPIYDDINPAYRYFGTDKLLEKTGLHQLTLNGSYNQQRQYGFTFNLNSSIRRYTNGLTDSIVYAANQQEAYVAQILKPMDMYSISFSGKKPFMISKTQTFSVQFNTGTNWGNKFQYVGTTMQEMLNNSQNIGLEFYYTVLDKYQVGWKNNLSRYERYDKLNEVSSNNYTSYSWNSGLSMSYAFTKRWSVNTNATGRYNTSGNYSDHAVIWNASTTYRMFKGNNLELKLSAYDLLRQNMGLYFNNGLTEFTTGYRNILTQYYMLSLTYFPRKFGFK